jgi:hypothetical protein
MPSNISDIKLSDLPSDRSFLDALNILFPILAMAILVESSNLLPGIKKFKAKYNINVNENDLM